MKLILSGNVPKCQNTNSKCEEWARSGYCGKNKQWMEENCCLACLGTICIFISVMRSIASAHIHSLEKLLWKIWLRSRFFVLVADLEHAFAYRANYRSSKRKHSQCRITSLNNFAKFTWKHLRWWSLQIEKLHHRHLSMTFRFCIGLWSCAYTSLHKKWSFPLRVSSVNVTKTWIWSHLLNKSLMENFIFCTVHEVFPK